MLATWILLIFAGLFEIGFSISLKLSDGFTKIKPIIAFIGFSILSFICLSKTLDKLPLGTAYLLWTGIGAVGTVIVGIVYFNEPYSAMRVFFISTMIISMIGLKLS
ncbi:MAG: multidrug efflux SMR transporter [Rickettsia endosymbiont of Culicoides impunctatus]|uniref:DMT family transporter n=1 Tax=unclassified Candidatus Tisiphia TaxID=2996318 RepID=UPI001E79D27B|nr:MAG: multidrug efflux SMR transporter [Rickettsia endosymbiont of Culicoides impunctatus]